MLNLNDFNSKVDAMLNDLPGAMTKVNVLMAQTAIPLIRKRLSDRGQTAEGKSLGTYSDRPMSALFFIGRGLGSGADKKVHDYANKNEGKISYKKYRELNNRPTDHVRLSFSGETLDDIGVLSSTVNGNVVKTVVGSLERHSKDVVNKKGKKIGTKTTGDVLDELNTRYGRALDTELLDLSKNEQADLVAIYESRLQKFLNEYFA
jgi:hypothetical protein